MAKKMIIKGVGQLMAKKKDEFGNPVEIVTLGSLQDLKIDMNVELEDIFGGDGLFALDSLVKSKSIEITATDIKFDLAAMEIMMGSEVQEAQDSYVWVLNEQHTPKVDAAGTAAEATLKKGADLYDEASVSVRLKDSNKLLTKVTGAPNAGEFKLEAGGKIVLHKDVATAGAEIQVNYQRTQKVDLVNILAEEVPFPVQVIHHGSFQQKDGSYQGIETELYACRAKGTFSINAQRSSASAASLTLQVIDPERADGALGSIKRYSSTERI